MSKWPSVSPQCLQDSTFGAVHGRMLGRWFGWQRGREVRMAVESKRQRTARTPGRFARTEDCQRRDIGLMANGCRLPAGDTADCQSALRWLHSMTCHRVPKRGHARALQNGLAAEWLRVMLTLGLGGRTEARLMRQTPVCCYGDGVEVMGSIRGVASEKRRRTAALQDAIARTEGCQRRGVGRTESRFMRQTPVCCNDH